MACGRPSVSTAIRDVVEPYGHVVPIRGDAAGFVEACEAILARTPQERHEHALALGEVISRTSWDATAAAMVELIAEAGTSRQGSPASLAGGIAAGTLPLASGAAAVPA